MSEDYDPLEKSKSQIKREHLQVQDIAKTLIELPSKDLDKVPLSSSALSAILAGREMQRSALKRQLKYIAKLLMDGDMEAVDRALAKILRADQEANRLFHQIERWRDQLMEGDQELMQQLVETLDVDRQYLNQLLRNAAKEKKLAKPAKSSRIIFKYLRDSHANAQ